MASSVRIASLLLIVISTTLIYKRIVFPTTVVNDVPSYSLDGSLTVDSFGYAASTFYSSFQSIYNEFLAPHEVSIITAPDERSLLRRKLTSSFLGTNTETALKNFFGKNLGAKDNQVPLEVSKGSTKRDTVHTVQIEDEKRKPGIKKEKPSRNATLPVNSFISPANGTDILSHPIAVIKCSNQTLCIQPKLQLTPKYDVYFCKHVGHGVRFYFLAKEGLLLHPNIRLIDDISKADIIVYLPVSAPWHKSECNKSEYKSKTVVLDEGDGQQLFEPDGRNYYLYNIINKI